MLYVYAEVEDRHLFFVVYYNYFRVFRNTSAAKIFQLHKTYALYFAMQDPRVDGALSKPQWLSAKNDRLNRVTNLLEGRQKAVAE